ncbi:2-hydroxyacid dehydrogenase [Acetobacter indonesiensis]|uniref:D-isomer specific 2-hydroxyacid dehydrogenase NAD-binding domain-containing protein n=1 Tax=Acetobacter indonesiensis TaxID=104101 RepID=A0A252AY42_9PROT|nr:glyoxylate/hydroxypyruvate reductase A [Acetobacter indonesiensis]OUI96731.1 hypothetical protein HK17_05590 [Acetobacter indonesiensis]
MVCLAVKSGGRSAFGEWKSLFATLMPDLDVRDWYDPALDLPAVNYVLVWEPDAGRLAQMPNLKAILSAAAGVDHITSDPTWPRHVPIIRMGGEETAAQMADYVQWAVFSLLREAPRWHVAQKDRQWARRGMPPVRLASETRVGIMGLGHLGAAVAQCLARAGFQVSGWARTPKHCIGVECHAGVEALPAFLQECNMVVCLLPETPQTRGIVTYEVLSQLKKPSGFINVGRGSLVVEADLLRALQDETLHGAVLDVFPTEPLPASSPLWDQAGLLITPHVASEASRRARARYVAETITALESGKAVALRYDPERGY